MTKFEALELRIKELERVVDEMSIFLFNQGSIEDIKAKVEEIMLLQEDEAEKITLIGELYNNCTLLQRLWLDIEASKNKMTKKRWRNLREFVKTKEIKIFSYN